MVATQNKGIRGKILFPFCLFLLGFISVSIYANFWHQSEMLDKQIGQLTSAIETTLNFEIDNDTDAVFHILQIYTQQETFHQAYENRNLDLMSKTIRLFTGELRGYHQISYLQLFDKQKNLVLLENLDKEHLATPSSKFRVSQLSGKKYLHGIDIDAHCAQAAICKLFEAIFSDR